MKKQPDSVSVFKSKLGKTVLEMFFGGKTGKHVHIDLGKARFSMVKSPDKNRLTVTQAQKCLERFMGKEAEVIRRGLFEVKLNELPETGMIRSLFFETKMGNVGIKMKGARFSITGAPVKGITWQAIPNNSIGVVLESDVMTTSFSENYLAEALTTLETAFNVFVLGKATNEPK